MQDRMSNKMSEYTSDRMSEQMSDHMLEYVYICVYIYVYVMPDRTQEYISGYMPWWGSHEVKLLFFLGVVKPICFLIREVIPKKFTFILLQR